MKIYQNLHGVNLKLFKTFHLNLFHENIYKISDIFFRDVFSLSKFLCEIADEKSYLYK